MRLAVLMVMLTAFAPREAAAQVIWVQPAPMFLMGPSLQESLSNFQLRALSAGVNIPVLGKEIVVEATLAPGATPSATCPTWFWGGWLSAGVLIPLGKSATDGFFVQPKVTASYFDHTQSGGGDCADPTALRWSSVEWGLGADVGFQATLGPFYVAPMIGATVGECINCAPQTTVLTPYTPYLGKAGERLSRLSFGLNLNLLRVGFVF